MTKPSPNEFQKTYTPDPEVVYSDIRRTEAAFIALEGIKGSTATFYKGPTPLPASDFIVEQLRANFPPGSRD